MGWIAFETLQWVIAINYLHWSSEGQVIFVDIGGERYFLF